MDNKQIVNKLESGNIRASIELSEHKASGKWYYDTRIFRPFEDPATGDVKRAYTFGIHELIDVECVAREAFDWINDQLENQETVILGQDKAA